MPFLCFECKITKVKVTIKNILGEITKPTKNIKYCINVNTQ